MNKSLKANILSVAGLKVISIALTFLMSIILARILGPTDYGNFVFITTLMWSFTLVVGPGNGQLITRESSKYFNASNWALLEGVRRFANNFTAIYSFVFLPIIALVAYESVEEWSNYIWGALTIPLLGWLYIKSAMLRGLGSVVRSQIPEMIVKPAATILLVGILWSVSVVSTEMALIAQALACLISLLLCHHFVTVTYPSEAKSIHPEYALGNWLGAVVPFSLIVAVGMFNNAIGVLILGALGDDESVAALKIAQTGSMLVSTALLVVNRVVAPEITKVKSSNDQEQLQALFKKSARLTTLMALPVSIPLIFFGDQIVSLLYGVEFADNVALPLAILSIGQLFNACFGLVGLFLAMSGYEKDSMAGQLIALLSNVALCAALVPSIGGVGVAYAIALSTVVWNLVLGHLMYKRLAIKPGPF